MLRDHNDKTEWIEDFFEDFKTKISDTERMIKHDFVEQACILACCYISALAYYRYPKSKWKDRKRFIRTVYEYSGHKGLFSKISWIDFYNKGKDSSQKDKQGKGVSCYEKIKAALLEYYGLQCNHHREVDKAGVIDYLRKEGLELDWCNLAANLDDFSYAAVLYEKYRCAGVHEGGIKTPRDVETGKQSFGQSEEGEDIYYWGNRLQFSGEIILSTLKNIHHNLSEQCVSVGKWPHEL